MGMPLVGLAVNPPPQNPGPLDLQKQQLSVQTLINQGKLQQQAQQDNAVAMQQRQIQLEQEKQAQQDQQVLRAEAPKFATKDANGNGTFDFEGFANRAQSLGVNPATINQMRAQQLELQTKVASLGKAKLENQLGVNKLAYETLEGVKGIDDPGQRQTAYQAGLNGLKMAGMDTSHLPQNAPDNKSLEAFEAQLGMHGQLLSDAKTLAETNEKNATASEKEWQKFPELGVMVNTRTGEQKNVAGAVMTPGMLESKYVSIQQKKNEGQPLSGEEAAFSKGYEKYKTLVPQFTNVMAITGGGLAPSPQSPTPPSLPGGPPQQPKQRTINEVPGAIRAEVQQVLDYRRADPSITQRGPVGQAINSWVAELDPQHDATTFPAKNKILTEYVKDASTGEIGAINTALGHLGDLYQASQALSKRDVPLLHNIASRLGVATGGSAETVYQGILHRVGPEMTKAYVKSGGTEGERGSNEADFDISKGAKQIQDNIFESANLLNSKLASKRNNWENTFQPYRDKDHFDNRFVTPEAQAILKDLGSRSPVGKGSGGSFSVKAPNGKTYSFKDQQSLDNFKAAAHL